MLGWDPRSGPAPGRCSMNGDEVSAHGTACARAALAGNPSDGYGGAVLAVTVPELRAEAWGSEYGAGAIDPPSELVEATVRRFARSFAEDASGPGLGGGRRSPVASASEARAQS